MSTCLASSMDVHIYRNRSTVVLPNRYDAANKDLASIYPHSAVFHGVC